MAPKSSGAMRGRGNSFTRRKAIRSHTGCVTCRARKVKCDERPGICLNCERLHLECQRSDGTSAAPPTSTTPIDISVSSVSGSLSSNLKRKRTYRSCTQCRSSKARCSGEHPKCARCILRGFDCDFEADSTPQWTRVVASSTSSKQHPSDDMDNDGDVRESIERPDGDSLPDTVDQLATTPSNASTLKSTVTTASSAGDVGNSSITSGYAQSISSQRHPKILARPPGMQANLAQSVSDSRASSVAAERPAVADDNGDSLAWLFLPHLPSRQRIRMLVKEYFDNIHPLRCYAFIHRPSFTQRLDESTSDDHSRNALLHVACALGAKFYALQYTDSLNPMTPKMILRAGTAWAKRAQSLLFADLNNISVQNLMTVVLLHDHELRTGNYASAFMLSGISARMAHALQLHLEFSKNIFQDEPDNGPTVCSKEARRRLMWSCYVADALIGSGIDQLNLFDEGDMKIQLPTNERNFVLQVPCVTEMLDEGRFLHFVPSESIPPRSMDNIGIVALYIRLVRIRKQVLRFVKRLEHSQPPWLPDSEFAKLDEALNHWYQQLPPSLQFTRAALYTRRESSQLGAFVLLQCTYNWTIVDLYRIALPKLYRLRLPWECSETFVQRLQETIFMHARRCSTVLADASRHGIKTLADTWLPSIAFDGNRLMLYYITQILGLGNDRGQAVLAECMPYFRSNLELLRAMQCVSTMAESLYPTAEEMLAKATALPDVNSEATPRPGRESSTAGTGLGTIGVDSTRTREATPEPNGPPYVFQPTSIYKMARNSIASKGKHASEKSRTPRIPISSSSSNPNRPPAFPSSSGPPSTTNNSHMHPPPSSSNSWVPSHSASAPATPNAGLHPTPNPFHTNPNTTPIPTSLALQLEPTAPAMNDFDAFLTGNTGRFTDTSHNPNLNNWPPSDTIMGGLTFTSEAGMPSWLPAISEMYPGTAQANTSGEDIGETGWPSASDLTF